MDTGTDRRTQRQTSCVVISEKPLDVMKHAGTEVTCLSGIGEVDIYHKDYKHVSLVVRVC